MGKKSIGHCWVKNGEPRGVVAVARTAGPQENFAAGELSRYVKLISGVELPVVEGMTNLPGPAIRILDASRPSNFKLLSGAELDKLKFDGYMIKSSGTDLVITSKEPFGVVFGVYQYLSKVLGVCFHDQSSLGEDIPYKETVEHAELDILRNPRLWYRSLQDVFDPDRIDWMAKNGFNYGSFYPPMEWWDKHSRPLCEELEKRGIKIAFGGHTFHDIIDERKYIEDNPEYFASVNGKPTPTPQFYWSLRNRDVLDEVIFNLSQFISRHPEIDILEFSPSDGIYEVDEEDYRSMTGEEMNREGEWKKDVRGASKYARLGDPNKAKIYALLAAPVAEALKEKFPTLRVYTIHYVDLIQPCPDVKLPENVIPRLAMYWRCAKHSLMDKTCPYNRQYQQVIGEWKSAYPERPVVLGEYYMGMHCHAGLPYPCLSSMFSEWDELCEAGIEGVKIQSRDYHGVSYNINYLAFAALAWKNPPSLDEFMVKYCTEFFREAGEPMLKMYRLWEESLQSAEHTQPGAANIDSIFTLETLDRCRGLLDEADRICVDSKALIRIARLRILTEYTAKAVRYAALLRSYDRQKTGRLKAELVESVRDIKNYTYRMIETGLNMFPNLQTTPLMQQSKEEREKWLAGRPGKVVCYGVWERLLKKLTGEDGGGWVAEKEE